MWGFRCFGDEEDQDHENSEMISSVDGERSGMFVDKYYDEVARRIVIEFEFEFS